MSSNGTGAYELKHCGEIHRASDFSELKHWVLEGRVSTNDSFRAAGTEKWFAVLNEPQFMTVLDPASQWTVTMRNGQFKTHQFETIVEWATEGRITEDAVVEGPRTPPGGVKASALPALVKNLRKPVPEKAVHPILRIDGREYPAPDTDTVRNWIKDSRVPVEAEISLEGMNWEPVSTCGLFDLEDWPRAAHGRVEEENLPEMPEYNPRITLSESIDEPLATEEEDSGTSTDAEEKKSAASCQISSLEEHDEAPYTVISGDSEMTIESVAKLKSLLKEGLIFGYDEVKHPSIDEETISVGELLESLKPSGKGPLFWIVSGIVSAAIVVSALDLLNIWEVVPWF